VKRGVFPSILKLSKIRLKRAPIFSLILTFNREKPLKPSFSVRVENTLNFSSVCQNKADLHLAQCLPMALQPILFLPLTITHMNHETLPERQCEGQFFRGGKIMNRIARVLSILQVMRFLLVFRSLLSESVNEFGQCLLPIFQCIIPDVKRRVVPPILK
jgi:hypothetical protein